MGLRKQWNSLPPAGHLFCCFHFGHFFPWVTLEKQNHQIYRGCLFGGFQGRWNQRICPRVPGFLSTRKKHGFHMGRKNSKMQGWITASGGNSHSFRRHIYNSQLTQLQSWKWSEQFVQCVSFSTGETQQTRLFIWVCLHFKKPTAIFKKKPTSQSRWLLANNPRKLHWNHPKKNQDLFFFPTKTPKNTTDFP